MAREKKELLMLCIQWLDEALKLLEQIEALSQALFGNDSDDFKNVLELIRLTKNKYLKSND